jgi:peptide/nickel transport system permease protein
MTERQQVLARDRPMAQTRRGGKILQRFSEENQERIAIFFGNPLSIAGLAVVLCWVLVAIFAPRIATFPEDAGGVVHLRIRLQWPSAEHWFGTDHMGRDIFSRVVIGSRISIRAGLIPILISLIFGVPAGAIAGYYGGKLETLIMRGADILLAMPRLVLAIAICAALGRSLDNAILAMASVWWPYYARIIYGQTLSLKENVYVEAARGMGSSHWRIIREHILPNCVSSIIVMFTMDLGFGILTMTSLSFIGMGAQPPSPEWGLAISIGRQYMPGNWWLTFFPGLAIFTVVLGFNLIGDGLRDALDPRTRTR